MYRSRPCTRSPRTIPPRSGVRDESRIRHLDRPSGDSVSDLSPNGPCRRRCQLCAGRVSGRPIGAGAAKYARGGSERARWQSEAAKSRPGMRGTHIGGADDPDMGWAGQPDRVIGFMGPMGFDDQVRDRVLDTAEPDPAFERVVMQLMVRPRAFLTRAPRGCPTSSIRYRRSTVARSSRGDPPRDRLRGLALGPECPCQTHAGGDGAFGSR